jgi:hypothetical protein
VTTTLSGGQLWLLLLPLCGNARDFEENFPEDDWISRMSRMVFRGEHCGSTTLMEERAGDVGGHWSPRVQGVI